MTIPEAEQDKNLEAKLLLELPGILNWALEGLQDYLKNGLDVPKAVQEATATYRKENDSLEQFISECCEIQKLNVCKNSELYSQYLNFCSMSRLKALSQTKFSPELSSRQGLSSTRTREGITWLGIALKKDWCRVEHNPTSQAGDAKGVGFEQNAQFNLNSSLREDLAHLTPNPTSHSDCNPTSPIFSPVEGRKDEENPGVEQFKRNMAKRKCGGVRKDILI
jgi:phage/plasmid-associated DNA primase